MEMKEKSLLTSKKDLPPPKLVKKSENNRINEEFQEIIDEEKEFIRSAEEESFQIRNALIELRRLMKEKKIKPKDMIAYAIHVMEERLTELSEIRAQTKDINLNDIK